MPGLVTLVLSLVALASVGLGWLVGFRAIGADLLFWSIAVCTVFAAVRIARRLFPDEGLSDSIIRIGTISFAIVVAGELLLGCLGLIRVLPHLVLFGGIWAASTRLRGPAAHSRRSAVPVAALLLIAALVPLLIFIVAVGMNRSPLALYDSLSYHLVFPARWLLEHRLSIVPTPFSDEAQAYAPANGELFFLWLMTPFHGDVLARIGQLPFYLLGGVAVYGLARQAGAVPAHAVYAPLFYFFSRPVVEQATGADVDLICWAMFLASIYLARIAADRDEPRDWLLWGVSAGLYCGSKYVALVYLPIVLLFAVRRGLRRGMVWALPGVLIFAAPWYLRNWIVGGSPIYPSSLTIAGLTLATGAYTRHAMQLSVFHTADLRLFPVMAAHAMGTDLLLIWIPAVLIGGWSMLTSRRGFAVSLATAPIAMSLLYWFGVPDNVDSRFLLPAAIVGLLAFAFAFRASRAWNICVHAAFAAGLLWIVVGRSGALPVALPWYMSGWLSLTGIVGRGYWLAFVAMMLLTISLAYALARKPARAAAALVTVSVVGCLIFAAGSETWCVPGRCEFLTPSPIYLRTDMVDGWRWVGRHIHDATIANAGNNVPYPLFGDHLSNRVYYVNIDRHRDWRFDDYDRARRHRRSDGPAEAHPLAVPSGVLLPLADPGLSQFDAARPRSARLNGVREAWIENLNARGVSLLFVTALSAYEIDYNWHDARGFPIEAEWARSDPAAFTLVFENAQVRIYTVHTASHALRFSYD